ncbi:MAG: COG1470 family protein [bacterium]
MNKVFFVMVVFAVLAAPVIADYSFNFVCRSDTLQQVMPGGVAYFYFTLTNSGSEPDVYLLDCRVLQEVSGWSAIYCLRGRCVEPGIPMYDTLAPGEADTTIDIAVFTTTTEGEEVIRFTVSSEGNPALSSSITTYTRVGSGVEEKESNYLTERKGELIFDHTGRRVKSISSPGVFFVRRGMKAGFQKLIVFK